MFGRLVALQKAFAYRLKPTQLVGWIDAVSKRLDNNPLDPVAILTVHFAAGVPTILSVASNMDLVPGDFVVTDNSPGDTSIEWAADLFRTRTAPPEAISTGTTTGTATAAPITDGARILTTTLPAAVAADCDFNLHIYGQ